jgi:hypothetical protein
VTPTDAPRFFQIVAFARMQTGDLPTARADANKWPSCAKEADEVETVPYPKLLSVRGNLVELDSSEAAAKLVVETSAGKVALILDEPEEVIISGMTSGTVELHCGPQKAAQVSIQFEPASASQTAKGSVRASQFQ